MLAAARSSDREGDVQELAPGFVMLELICDHSQGESLHMSDRLVLSRSISKDARQLDDLRDPAAIGLALKLDSEDDRHSHLPTSDDKDTADS